MHRFTLLGIAFVIASAILFSGAYISIQISTMLIAQSGLIPTDLLLSPLDIAVISASAILFIVGCILALWPFKKK